jgi:hypothetical protein
MLDESLGLNTSLDLQLMASNQSDCIIYGGNQGLNASGFASMFPDLQDSGMAQRFLPTPRGPPLWNQYVFPPGNKDQPIELSPSPERNQMTNRQQNPHSDIEEDSGTVTELVV